MRPHLRLTASALLLAMVMPLTPIHAEEDNGDVTEESLDKDLKSLDQELADFSSERRDQLIGDVEDVLDAIESRIATLDSRLRDNWDSADRLERAQAQTAVAALRRERSRVMEWHQRMQDSTGFTWESMKDGFNDAFDELAEAWQNAEQNVRKAVEEE
ncbi:MAG: hypothetical protein R6U69_04805 [Marinobacter sp.]|uniref:hypothetical protein n=1 Tax=Marinobacter sp. TaxID=50741 RepID=UPI003565B552